MDLEYDKTQISQSDVCRCCLSASGSCNMNIAYESESGIKEIYRNMLQECFGISLGEWGLSPLICSLCIAQLRLASAFKKQVQWSERQFHLYYKKQTECSTVNRTEKANETENFSLHNESDVSGNLESIKKFLVMTADNEVRPFVKPVGFGKWKRKKSSILKMTKTNNTEFTDNSYDSDTPIAELIKLSSNNNEKNDDEFKMSPVSEIHKLKNYKGQKPTKRYNPVKRISERKRVKLTCATVLRDTTACPFRHHKSWFQCFFCFQDFMEINTLRDHTLRIHSDVDAELLILKSYPRSLQIDISDLQCRHCSLTLTGVNDMCNHFHAVHGKTIYVECIADYKVDSSPYTCHICGRDFHVFRTLTTHLNEHYANCICDVCGKSFLNTRRLEVHKRTHDRGNYPCTKCGKVLKTKTSKANHMESVHSNRVIKCQICYKPMKHYNDRMKHMSDVHGITHNFKCPFCNRDYKIKHYLATHIRQTHGHKNKKCTECDMAFITNHALKKHMLKHTGEKPYTCTVCCKSYARNYTLREHMRVHDRAKSVSCAE